MSEWENGGLKIIVIRQTDEYYYDTKSIVGNALLVFLLCLS